MGNWIKRIFAAALVIAGVVLLVRHVGQLLDWPHLYPDLGQLGKRNLLFLGLTLLALSAAWISGAYLLLNTDKGILHQLIPAVCFALVLFGCGLSVKEAVGEIPCTYTTSLAACREEFQSEDFRVQGKPLYPTFPMGELTGYAFYEKGEILAESVTRTYDQEGFNREAARLAALNLPAFHPPQDPREREITCYELQEEETVWQVLLVPKTKSVTYSRFIGADQLPDFAPQPTEQGTTAP